MNKELKELRETRKHGGMGCALSCFKINSFGETRNKKLRIDIVKIISLTKQENPNRLLELKEKPKTKNQKRKKKKKTGEIFGWCK